MNKTRWMVAWLALAVCACAAGAEPPDSAVVPAMQAAAPDLLRVTLKEAVDRALAQNLSLKARDQLSRVDAAAVRQAGAALGPSLTAAVSQVALDKDRAEASLGRAPQYRTSASLQVNQLLYGDAPRANRDVQHAFQQAGQEDRRDDRLNIVIATGRRYLGLLQAQAQQRILADDLRLTNSNYDRARVRLDLGVANKAEVYRWQSRQASARKLLRSAQAAVTRARVELNLVLNRPLEEEIGVVDPSLEDRGFLIADPQIWPRLVSGEIAGPFRDYCLHEAVSSSPTLAALRHRREAQERLLVKAHREERLPTVEFALNAVSYVATGGAGTEQLSFTVPGSGVTVGGVTDDNEWTASLTAALPLYRGGARSADIQRADAEAERVNLQYDAALQRVHADVLDGLATFEASLANIQYANDAASAARNNLDLVTDSYARGIVTIIDLLDAQVASLSAQLAAANAEYDFLNAYLDLQLGMGRFDIILPPEEWNASLARLRSRLP